MKEATDRGPADPEIMVPMVHVLLQSDSMVCMRLKASDFLGLARMSSVLSRTLELRSILRSTLRSSLAAWTNST